jgi:hypothetical protein
MTGSLVSLLAAGGPPGANIVAKVLSDDVGRAALDRILSEAKEFVRDLLDEHRAIVETLRDALLERDELVADEIEEVILASGATSGASAPSGAISTFLPRH